MLSMRLGPQAQAWEEEKGRTRMKVWRRQRSREDVEAGLGATVGGPFPALSVAGLLWLLFSQSAFSPP